MSGYRDIDGSLVSIGSPSLSDCAETELRSLAGEFRDSCTWLPALVKLSEIDVAKHPEAASVVRRAKDAIVLIRLAVRVFNGEVES